MDNNTLISLIITCYNQEIYLNQLLEFLKQHNSFLLNVEIIVIDSSDIPVNLNTNISYYRIKNLGPSHARNFGITKASGEWVIFCDADDIVNPNIFSFVSSKKNIKNYNVILFPYKRILDDKMDEALKEIQYFDLCVKSIVLNEIVNPIHFINYFHPINTFVIKKSLFTSIRFNEEQWFVEDVRFALELLLSDIVSLAYVPEKAFTSLHRDFKNKQSLSTSNDIQFWKCVCSNYDYLISAKKLNLLDRLILVKIILINFHSVSTDIKTVITSNNKSIWNNFFGLPKLFKSEFLFKKSLLIFNPFKCYKLNTWRSVL